MARPWTKPFSLISLISVVLFGAWLLPPLIKEVRHLCPLRPDGIPEAEAIPVFARKYKTSCLTCHAPVPIKLNNFGEAFKNNAFRMPADDEALTKIEMQELGAEATREQWWQDIYPGLLPTELPISFQTYLDARWDPHKESAGTRNARDVFWDVPHEFELMTAGTLGKHISFWSNIEFKVKDKTAITAGETPVDFVQAYGQFDHLWNNTSLLNLRIGRFEPRVVPFSRVSRRSIAEDFLTSGHTLSNGFNFKTMQGGVELWGAKSVAQTGGGFTYAFGVVNGDGSSNSDTNRHQDLYGRFSYKLWGMGVAESLGSAQQAMGTRNWLDDSLRVGVYGYRGWSGTTPLRFEIGGADLDFWYKQINLYATAWTGMEDVTATTRQKATAYTIGADYILRPWLTGILRYEGADRGTTAAQHKRRVVPAVVIGIRPNITWTTEGYLYNRVGDLKTGDEMVRSRLRFIF